MSKAIRSLAFYFGLVVSTALFGPLGLFLFPLKFETRYYIISRWTVFNLWWLKVTCGLSYSVQGTENIPDRPAIVMCKHQSTMETLILQLLFVPQVWVLKRELLRIPVYGWGLAALQPIAIDRGSALRSFRQIVSEGRKRLEQGAWVVIFPEGTRIAPGERGKYLPGGALLAEKSGFPICPVAHNAGYYWPRRGFIKQPGRVEMVIGPVIETTGRSAAEINALVEEAIESQVARLPASDS
jgi:1-acyl-sn-glycerol-3-phosphate acyltransferase